MDQLDVESAAAPLEAAPVATASATATVPATPAPKPKAVAASVSKGQTLWATGRRKRAIARVRIVSGTGTILVNQRPYEQYFPREGWRLAIRQPLIITQQLGKLDVVASAVGGGLTCQADAVKLGIARALVELDPALRTTLRAAGLLTRDPRERERKKYGQKGARKRFQWTKR